MADRYVNIAYLREELGADLMLAIQRVDGVVIERKIERATALVQAHMRNAGYSPPSTQDPTAVEEVVKLATLGILWPMLAHTPELNLPLPEDWDEHPAREAYQGLKNETLQLAAEPSKIAARGGWKASSHADTSTGFPQRASRSELKGY